MHQKSASFDEYTQNVLDITTSHCGVVFTDLISSKKREVVNAKSIIAVILRENGHTYQSIADILNLDVAVPHNYVNSHDNRLADKGYASMYSKVLNSIKNVESIDGDIYSKVNNLLVRLEKVENRINHLTALLTA